MRTMARSQQLPEKINTFQPEVIKKEPADEDDTVNIYENNFQPVKEEYYSKSEPELNLDWDEKYNIYGTNPEDIDISCNIVFSKLYNTKVLLERLPDSILIKFSHAKDIDLKTKNLSAGTVEHILAAPKGDDATSAADNLPKCSRCTKQFKSQLNLRHHLLYCGKLPHLQCSHCAYKTKYKSALNSHTLFRHSAKKITGKNLDLSTETSKRFKKQRNSKVLKSHVSGCNKKTMISSKNNSFKAKGKCILNRDAMKVCSKNKQVHSKIKNTSRYSKGRLIYYRKNGLQCKQCSFTNNHKTIFHKHMKKAHFNNLQACSKCYKKFKYKKSFEKHVTHCKGNLDLQTNLCSQKTEKGDLLNKHILLKKFKGKAVIACLKCNKKFKYKKSLEKHLNHCEGSLNHQVNQCLYKITKKNHLNKHTTSKKFAICPKCAKKFEHERFLKGHLTYCGKKPNLQCKHCSFKTKYSSNLAYHVSHTHVKRNQEAYPNCNKLFKKQNNSKVHSTGQTARMQACPRCYKWYINQLTLKRHLFFCRKERNLRCDHCSYKTSRKGDLAKHTGIHLEKNINYFLSCSKCYKNFKTQQSLTKHSYFCGKEPHLQCDYCSYKTNMKQSLTNHILRVHLEKDVNNFLPCLKCGKRYKNQPSLARHSSFCGKEPHLQCDHCSYKTSVKQSLTSHILRVHLEKDVNHFLPCSKCGKRYKNQSTLARHSDFCGKEPHLQCDYCPYKTKMKSNLASHILLVHLEKDVNYLLPCTKCGKRYKNKQSLTRHSSLCGNEANLQCDYCSYRTQLKATLGKHILNVHLEKDVNYFLPCSKCGKKYKNKDTLARHSYLCGAEPLFQCDYCSRKAVRKADLAKHILAVHLEKDINYSLPCSKCGKKYKNHRSLTRHLYLCGKELHLQCDYCSYKTNMKSSLKKHIVAIHLEKDVHQVQKVEKNGPVRRV